MTQTETQQDAPADGLPADGFYQGVSEAEYRAWPAVNWSSLKEIAHTPCHYRNAVDNPTDEPTDEQDLGTLFHAMLLEPDAARGRFIVAPHTYPSESSTGRGANKVTEIVEKPWNMNATFCKDWKAVQEAAGRVVVKPAELQAARAMVQNVLEIPAAVLFLKGAQTEVSMIWTDAVTGLRCKGRIDFLNNGLLGDCKSTSKPLSWEEFARECKYWGYAGQAAFYLDGAMSLLAAAMEPLPAQPMFRFICAETAPPYAAAVYDLIDVAGSVSKDWLDHGRNLYRRYLHDVKRCVDDGRWPTWNQDRPGEPPEARELAVPDYIKLDLGGWQ